MLAAVETYYFVPKGSVQSAITPPKVNSKVVASPHQVTPGLPVRLKIPGINVNTAVEQLGLTADGAMAAPNGPDDVAWYNLGPRPGAKGSAVMAGHSNWNKGAPAVFDNLNKLRPGDKLYVDDGTGALITFTVREARDYDQNDDAAGVFGSSDGRSHLNLITCEGAWNKTSRSYSKRLVVFADKD